MKHSSYIASHRVVSDARFVVFGPAAGLIGASDDFQTAQRLWIAQRAKCQEWGKETDAFVYQWSHDQWCLCGSLYDLAGQTHSIQP